MNTVVSIFPPPLSLALSTHISPSQPHPWLCPWVLYSYSFMSLSLLSHIISLSLPLWILSVCCQFQCLRLYIACQFVLLIRFHLWERSYGICLSLPDLLHLAYYFGVPSMLSGRVGAPFFLLCCIPLCKCTIVY